MFLTRHKRATVLGTSLLLGTASGGCVSHLPARRAAVEEAHFGLRELVLEKVGVCRHVSDPRGGGERFVELSRDEINKTTTTTVERRVNRKAWVGLKISEWLFFF